MKKLVGILVVLAMVLAVLPMAAFAVPGTYDVSVGFNEDIDLYADDQVTLLVDAQEQDVILTVDGFGIYTDWCLDDGMQLYRPEINGAYSLKLDAGQVYELTLVSDSFFEDQQLNVSLTAPAVGTESNPDNLVMGESSVNLDGNNAYFYSFTAAEDGKLEFSIDVTKSSDWAYYVNVKKTAGGVQYGDTHFSDDAELVSSESVFLKAGDVVTIYLNTCTFFVPATVYFQAAFTAGEVDDGADENSVVVVNEPVTAAAPYTYSFLAEGPGDLRVIMGDCTPDWRYKI